MSKQVVYRGRDDFRELNSDDVQKAGVEPGKLRKTSFPRNEPVEVEDSVADALIENPELFGSFALHESAEQPALDGVDEVTSAEKGEATSTTDSTPSTTGATRNAGSSTRTK